MVRRWAKLEKDFLNKSGVFDISKIPDIYDCIKYDLLHNINILQLEQVGQCYTNMYLRLTDIFSVFPYFIEGFVFHFTEIG